MERKYFWVMVAIFLLNCFMGHCVVILYTLHIYIVLVNIGHFLKRLKMKQNTAPNNKTKIFPIIAKAGSILMALTDKKIDLPFMV